MFLTLLVLSSAAFAAPPSTCGTSGTDVCVDDDGDGSYPNAKVIAEQDCDDSARLVFPGAPAALGDGVKNDCSATGPDDDDAETAAALAAACGLDSAGADACASTDPKVSVPAIARRDAFEIKFESCTVNPQGGVWGKEGTHPYTCLDLLLPGSSWSKATGVATKADNAERRARKAGDAALWAELGTKGVAAVAATKDTPAVEAVAPTGLYAELAELELAITKADTATKVALEAQKAEVKALIATFETRLGQTEAKVTVLQGEMRGLKTRVSDLEEDGIFFAAGVNGTLIGQPSILAADGSVVTGSVTGGGAFSAAFGPQWYGESAGHIVVLDVTIGGGGVGTDGGSLPATFGTVGAAALWQPLNTDIAVGPKVLGVLDSAGNPLTAQASGWGVGGGMKAIYMLPLDQHDTRSRVGLNLDLAGTVGTAGTNGNQWTNPAFVGSFGITYIHGVATPADWFR